MHVVLGQLLSFVGFGDDSTALLSRVFGIDASDFESIDNEFDLSKKMRIKARRSPRRRSLRLKD